MKVVIISNILRITPAPKADILGGIEVYVKNLEDELNTGRITADIYKGQTDYRLPEGITVDDIADIKVSVNFK